MAELRNAQASRWDFDRGHRLHGLASPFSRGVSHADVDCEIECNGRFLVIEGKREGQEMSTGQRRAMEARVREGRTCVVIWGDPDIHEITQMAVLYLDKEGRVREKRMAATWEDFYLFERHWWQWADRFSTSWRKVS